ncbi:interleukin-12 receptor subunit beta-1 isoform X2 [Anas acuta]|uniref:interleukin-12 receptor subunit beta-1 isoform X2 n=1 Tax=Anas acuta TaxID=28680 RepID=UPI0035C900BE
MLGWLLLALAALARGGTAEPPDFSCFKQCGSCDFLCSWPPRGPAGNTTYVLVLCYATARTCWRYKAGAATTYTLPRHRVYVLTNTTAWVEARWGPHLHRSPNLTLYLDEAVKLDPPPDGMNFAKAKGLLQLRVPRPPLRGRERALSREARFRGVGNHSWTQVLCETGKSEDSKEDPVTCDLGGNAAFEVQLRQKTQHWSSYWSDWSKSIFVPEEILESPELSFQLGNLGKNGQRLLQLSWQRARKEQGNVTYTLSTHMPACRCAALPEADEVVLGPEVRAHNLTLCGAEYEILLTATNAAGTSPTRQLHVPPEQHAELSFKDISSAGEAVTVRWEAPSRGFAYCFEQQPLPGAPRQGVCVQQEFPAKSSHLENGSLEAPACYRLAVHGWSAEQGWATFALQHHFAGNTSLASSIRINASAEAAVLRWEPSPRATCPGALARYLVCHAAEGDNETYGEADALASRYTLRNLRPGTAYRVGIQEVAADGGGSCSTPWHFQTMALGPRLAAWKSNLRYLGISLGLPAIAAVIYQLSKRRARQLLFPPLPKPVGSRAIQFSASEMSQALERLRRALGEVQPRRAAGDGAESREGGGRRHAAPHAAAQPQKTQRTDGAGAAGLREGAALRLPAAGGAEPPAEPRTSRIQRGSHLRHRVLRPPNVGGGRGELGASLAAGSPRPAHLRQTRHHQGRGGLGAAAGEVGAVASREMGQEGDERGPTGTRGDAERPPRGAAPWACGAFWGVSDFQELLLNIPKVLPMALCLAQK